MMLFSFATVIILTLTGIASLRFPGASPTRQRLLSTGALLACALGFVPVVDVLSNRLWDGGGSFLSIGTFLGKPLSLGLDPLSALFDAILLVVFPIVVVFGNAYQTGHHAPRRASGLWIALLGASIHTVFLAQSGIVFLLAWEAMALSSFFLVLEDGTSESRAAGWIYLVASHAGTAFLIVLFLHLSNLSGSWSFAAFANEIPPGTSTNLLFTLGIIGFGTKAGLLPMHVWLPEAHPAAPSHASALLSGVLVKTGIYGILRLFVILGPPSMEVSWSLLLVGLATGIYGIVAALPQRDAKRLLAYSTVENIGIIVIGLGIGMIGYQSDFPLLALMGIGGALLHALNHALIKSLLFMGVGAVVKATGTRQIDHMGGLLKRMPRVGLYVAIAAASVAALPPFNGFVGKFLIYVGTLQHLIDRTGWLSIPAVITFGGLALIGGLTLAAFTKLFGIVFLGEPRTLPTRDAVESSGPMVGALATLTGLCLIAAVSSPWLARMVVLVAAFVIHAPTSDVITALGQLEPTLYGFLTVAAIMVGLTIGLWMFRQRLYRGRPVNTHVTWDCGYALSDPRVQYTGSSFTAPISELFTAVMRVHRQYSSIKDFFPESARFHTDTPDTLTRMVYYRLFRAVENTSAHLLRMQTGRVHLYISYIVAVMAAVLLWKLR